jgi:hypothetical protein
VWAVHGFEDVIPRTTGRAGAGAILGLSAAFGWGLMAFGFAMHVKGKIAAAEAAAAKEQAWQEERAAQDLAKFRALPADAPLPELLEFIHSWNAAIQKEARERIAARPNLEDELIAGLSSDWSEAAVGYIAFIDDKPSARYAPALALVLDHQVEVWRSTFEYDEYASKWEPNISRFVEAATKVQAAGGNLKPQIQAWYDLIRKAKGMEGMAMYLRAALERS